MEKIKIFKIYDDRQKQLRKECLPVSMPLNEEIKTTLIQMVEYLKASQDDEFVKKNHIRAGVGLAAPQIGILQRFFAIYYVDENGKEVQYGLVNPKIIESSVKKCALSGGEGCLSVKFDHQGYVYRYYKITMRAYDVFQDKMIDITAKGYDAIVLQHEYDHLNGILYYDRINKHNPKEILPNSILI